MEDKLKINLLQKTYITVLADSVQRMGNFGILEEATQVKKKEQMASGKLKAEMFGFNKAEQVFLFLSELVDCVNWKIKENGSGFTATAKSCKLCAATKDLGAKSPCNIYCLDPIEGMIKGIDPETVFKVQEKLWDGKECRIEVNRKK